MLVRAAFRAIAAKGFEGLRLRDVAHAAGIDHSTLHHHFPTKRDLVDAVLEYATEQFRPPQRPPDSPPTTLAEHLGFLARMIVDRPELHRVLREIDLRATRDREVRAAIVEREKGWRSALGSRISAAAAEGSFPEGVDAAVAAELMIATIKGASLNPSSAVRALDLFERLLTMAAGAPPSRRGAAAPGKRR